ncbi:MAG: hypothetical protein ABJF04_07115 [Reichenbachiella sp.]|uniref:hypothetical protein n=1 Tax=Reichenbachiella sp. TaxID=2184521 RepID=UPI0032640FAA
MKKYTCVLMCLLIGATFSPIYSQSVSTGYSDFLPPSPSAGASGASGGGLAQGMSGVSIPLANFATNQLSVPVSLSYYSTGTKVDQLASNVGLGWSLQAGGVITRTVRDDRDEISPSAYPTDIYTLTTETLDFLENATDPDQDFDTEPDLFSFNFMGYSGSFVIDSHDTIRVMPYQNLRIEKNDSLDYIHITTPDGIRYEFGGTGATETSKSWYSGTYCQSSSSGYADSVKTAWHLKTIIHPVEGQIDLEYDTASFSYIAGKTQTYYDTLSSGRPAGQPFPIYPADNCDVNIKTDELIIKKISATHFGSIEFASSERPGIGNTKLDSVFVKSASGDTLRKVLLKYEFTANDRMFLTQVTDIDADSTQEGLHVFDYYDIEKLPERLKFAQDHWGYYNGKLSSTFLLPTYDTIADAGDASKAAVFSSFTKADRSADADYAKYGMLRSIVYPSSMFTTFEYEANILSDASITGGLRLKGVVNHDPVTGQKDSTRYYYGQATSLTTSSGQQSERPDFWSYYSEFTNRLENTNDSCNYYGCTYASLQSNSLNSLYNTRGHHLSYEYVTVVKGDSLDNGGITYQFLQAADTSGTVVYGELISGTPLSNRGWNDGLLKKSEVFKLDGSGNPVVLRKTEHTYQMDSANYTEIPAAAIRKTFETDCEQTTLVPCTDENNDIEYLIFCRTQHTHNYTGPIGECIAADNDNSIKVIAVPPCVGYDPGDTVVVSSILNNVDVVEYKNYSFWQYLKSTTTSQYDEDGNNPVTTTVTYHYDSASHAQLTSVDSDASIEGTITTSYTYPQDYGGSGGAVIDSMVSRHLVGIPVETVKKVGSNVVSAGATKFSYDSTNDWVVPEVFYAWEDTGGTFTASSNGTTFSSYTKKGEVLARDNKGQVISQRAENNIISSVIRGYNQTLVVASITNADTAQVKAALPALDNDLSAGTGALSGSDITTLKTALPQALITTYTYKIGYGVETMTDPNGRTTTYVYDDYGRVEYVKDHDGNIRSASEYHNKSQKSNQ